MAILLDDSTKLIVQGITGNAGKEHTRTMLEYGTRVVAGVRPGAGGETIYNVPVFNTVKEAVEKTGANASALFVPGKAAKEAAFEAIDAGVKLLVIIPEYVPLHDALKIVEYAKSKGTKVIGPNTAGLIVPKYRCKIGFVPNRYFVEGNVGVISRSGTLMYELVSRMTTAGFGQSTCVGVGGDPVIGTRFADLLLEFEKDNDTKCVLMIGEVGGSQEEEAAKLIIDGKFTKPLIAYMAGSAAPEGKRMGHAGAIISNGAGSMASKEAELKKANAKIARKPDEVLEFIRMVNR